ncbi:MULTISPECIES: nuclear transport factor 2 family protein [Frankia]|uniref:nuclear transport factor 2 family protein n=1 Tax=Frankia TaxID=1854 RepID=UPI0002D74714|nr:MULTISPECIES: nuclear transport factor 2 family protein [Frankia]
MTDIGDIRTLIARFAHLGDRERHDQWAEHLVVDDFTYRTEDDPLPEGDGLYQGRGEVLAHFRAGASGRWRATHFLSEPVIDVAGGRAHAATDFALVRLADRLPAAAGAGAGTGPAPADAVEHRYEVAAAGRYEDDFVRGADGRWRFTARLVTHMPLAARQPAGAEHSLVAGGGHE